MEAIPKSDIRFGNRFDIRLKQTTWIGHKVSIKGPVLLNNLAPTFLLLPLGKWGSKWGDFHWATGCV